VARAEPRPPEIMKCPSVIIEVGFGFGLIVRIICWEMLRHSGAGIQKTKQEPTYEHRNDDLSSGVVNVLAGGLALGQVRVHLDEVSLAQGKRDGNFLGPTV
jgi:hypothetical protein